MVSLVKWDSEKGRPLDGRKVAELAGRAVTSTKHYAPMKSPFSSNTPSLRRIAYASVT